MFKDRQRTTSEFGFPHHDSEEPEERSQKSEAEPEEEEEDEDDDESSNQGSGANSKKRKGSSLEMKEDAQSTRKVNIEYITKKDKRQITFSKRKAGIMKKAYELATLTGTQVLLLIVSEGGVVFTFSTSKFQPLVSPQGDGQPSAGQRLIHHCLAVDGEDLGDISPPPDQARPAIPSSVQHGPIASNSRTSARQANSRTSKFRAPSVQNDIEVVAGVSSSPTGRIEQLSGHQPIPSSPLRPLPPLQHLGQAVDYSIGPSGSSGGLNGMVPVRNGSYYDGRGGMMEGPYSQQNSIYGHNPNLYDSRNAMIYPPDLRYPNNDPTQRPFPAYPPQYPHATASYRPVAHTPDPHYIDPNLRQHQRSSSSTSATASSSRLPPPQDASPPRQYPPVSQQPQQHHQQQQEMYPQ